jgi:hypothetical protein
MTVAHCGVEEVTCEFEDDVKASRTVIASLKLPRRVISLDAELLYVDDSQVKSGRLGWRSSIIDYSWLNTPATPFLRSVTNRNRMSPE